jgi:hypothetical protein
MTLGVRTHRTADIGDGPATRREYGPEPQHEEPMRRGGGKSRLPYTQYWHRKSWELHTRSLSWLRLALSSIVGYYCPMKYRFFPPQKGQKSSLEAV